MDYWKSKVLPKLKTMCGKGAGKKADAEEIVKSFDESKEDGINSEFKEKKADLHPKVIEIYDSATAPVKDPDQGKEGVLYQEQRCKRHQVHRRSGQD
jgi:hypothetical protein